MKNTMGMAILLLLLMVVPAWGQGVLFVEGTNVGVGVETPAQRLHVEGSDGSTRLLVKEASADPSQRVLLVLQNQGNGSAKLRISSGSSFPWDFQTQSTGFAFSRVGTPGSELFIRNDGQVRLGPGGANNLVLDPSGNLTIAGSLTENSSRDSKYDFEEVDTVEVLRQVSEMSLTRWTYRADQTGARHIGPMAEDFHAAFGLGADATHIGPGDKAGVALAAIQGLSRVIEEKDREIEELRARLETLEAAIRNR